MTSAFGQTERSTFPTGGTLTIDPGIDPEKNFFINGFAYGDKVLFANQDNLTLSAFWEGPNNIGNGEVDIYSGSNKIATLSFAGLGANEFQLEPISTSGGTEIILDTKNVSLENYQVAPGGFATDWDWSIVAKHEGNSLAPYAIPLIASTTSGVTIAQGLDLAKGITFNQFENLFLGYSNDIPHFIADPNLSFLASLAGATGDIGQKAITYLQTNGGTQNARSNSFDPTSLAVSLTTSQANTLTNFAREDIANGLVTVWGTGGNVALSQLPPQAQTVLLDIAYQFGPKGEKTNALGGVLWTDMRAFATSLKHDLSSGLLSPSWALNTTELGKAQEVYTDLIDMSATYAGADGKPVQRYIDDANLIATIPGFVKPDAAEPPLLTVKNATASETATSIPLSITDSTADSDDTLLPVTITGVPTSWTLSDGLSAPTNLGNGTWSVAPDALASLVILSPTGGFEQGAVKLTVTASNLDMDGTATETLSTTEPLTVTVAPDAAKATLATSSGLSNNSHTLSDLMLQFTAGGGTDPAGRGSAASIAAGTSGNSFLTSTNGSVANIAALTEHFMGLPAVSGASGLLPSSLLAEEQRGFLALHQR
jgi:hypothetical protein